MAKKVFNVVVELEIPVFAETAEEAIEVAYTDALKEEVYNLNPEDLRAKPATYFASGYDKESLVWHDGSEGEILLKDALEQTPEYLAYNTALANKLSGLVTCDGCGKQFPKSEAIFGACPYDEDVKGITRDVWLCVPCRKNRLGDI